MVPMVKISAIQCNKYPFTISNFLPKALNHFIRCKQDPWYYHGWLKNNFLILLFPLHLVVRDMIERMKYVHTSKCDFIWPGFTEPDIGPLGKCWLQFAQLNVTFYPQFYFQVVVPPDHSELSFPNSILIIFYSQNNFLIYLT